jgi:hypothetical protein
MGLFGSGLSQFWTEFWSSNSDFRTTWDVSVPLTVWWPGGKVPFLDPVWWLGLRAMFEQMGGSYFAKYPNPSFL